MHATVLAGERLLPLVPALAATFPAAGLRRGATVVVDAGADAQGAVSLALALAAGASAAGSWCAVVGVPDLGPVAAAELGARLDRLALVPRVEPRQWVTVVGALLDSVDLVIAHPPAHLRDGDARRLTARARERGTTLIPLRPGRVWSEGADVRMTVTASRWEGPGAGDGHLRSRLLDVTMGGRGSAARPRRLQLSLPVGAAGDVEVVTAVAFAGADADRLPDGPLEQIRSAG